MSGQGKVLEVWLDCDLGPACLVGTLAHDRGQVRFHYDRHWLGQARAFALDPDLSLDEHPFFPKPELGNFGVFLDSSPDRWGQTLMKRREALQCWRRQRRQLRGTWQGRSSVVDTDQTTRPSIKRKAVMWPGNKAQRLAGAHDRTRSYRVSARGAASCNRMHWHDAAAPCQLTEKFRL